MENFTKLETQYFTVEKIDVNGIYEDKVNNNFHSYTVINGRGYITDGKDKIDLKKIPVIFSSELPFKQQTIVNKKRPTRKYTNWSFFIIYKIN